MRDLASAESVKISLIILVHVHAARHRQLTESRSHEDLSGRLITVVNLDLVHPAYGTAALIVITDLSLVTSVRLRIEVFEVI